MNLAKKLGLGAISLTTLAGAAACGSNAMVIEKAAGTWECSGEMTDGTHPDFDVLISPDGWWSAENDNYRGKWNVDGGEVEITFADTTNVVPASIESGSTHQQTAKLPYGIPADIEFEVQSLESVRVKFTSMFEGDLSCQKISSESPSAEAGERGRDD